MVTKVQIADTATIERARSGDSEAMAELWRIYQPQILRFLRAKRSPCVDDVASQVWIDAGRGLHRFSGDGVGMQRWLFTIANCRSIDEIRRVARRRQAVDDGLSDQWKKGHLDEIDEFDGVERAVALLRQLPQRTSEAVTLRVVFDLSVADTASILGCTEGNVRVLVHRGLNRLRELVVDDGRPTVTARRSDAVGPGGHLTIAAAVGGFSPEL